MNEFERNDIPSKNDPPNAPSSPEKNMGNSIKEEPSQTENLLETEETAEDLDWEDETEEEALESLDTEEETLSEPQSPQQPGQQPPFGDQMPPPPPFGGQQPPFRNIYGQPYQQTYQPQPAPPMPPKKKKNSQITLSGSTLAFILVCCMLVTILLTASFQRAFQDPSDGNLSDTTTSSNETSSSGNSETTNPDHSEETTASSQETAPSISIGSGSVIGNTNFPEYEVYAKVANECVKSVVVIRVTETVVSYGQEYTTSGAGSGVIFDKDGYIVTNYHVVGKNTDTISVELYDGTVYDGTYIYGDEFVDLAVIKINKTNCDAAKIGDSAQMALGQMVVAIGNPLGYGLTVTPGIISALQRSVTVENTTMTLMQTSAAINSGNSGGGLFNMNGELIGIVNAKVGGTSVEAMGYAIPSTTVVKSLNDLKEYGYITGKARLGVTVQTKQYQVWPYLDTHNYIQVAEINPKGSAANSGLQIGDILYQFNGMEISSFEILSEQLTRYQVGDTVTLTIRRPTIELTKNNLAEYLNTSEQMEIKITFVEFDPNA